MILLGGLPFSVKKMMQTAGHWLHLNFQVLEMVPGQGSSRLFSWQHQNPLQTSPGQRKLISDVLERKPGLTELKCRHFVMSGECLPVIYDTHSKSKDIFLILVCLIFCRQIQRHIVIHRKKLQDDRTPMKDAVMIDRPLSFINADCTYVKPRFSCQHCLTTIHSKVSILKTGAETRH